MFQVRTTVSKFVDEANYVDFQCGSLYLIVCMDGQRALELHSDLMIGGATPRPEDSLQQLWFVKSRPDRNKSLEIINFSANKHLCHDSTYSSVRSKCSLTDGFYFLQHQDTHDGLEYYTISTSKSGDTKITKAGFSLSLEEYLQPKLTNPFDERQLFRFVKINERVSRVKQIMANCIIVHSASGKVLDIPFASIKDEEKIIIWPKNRRLHQRWTLKKQDEGNKYEIRNVASQKYMDIASEARTPNSKVIQFRRKGLSNQFWLLENVGNGLFIIRSSHEESLVLGVLGESTENGASVGVVKQNCFWRLDGYFQR